MWYFQWSIERKTLPTNEELWTWLVLVEELRIYLPLWKSSGPVFIVHSFLMGIHQLGKRKTKSPQRVVIVFLLNFLGKFMAQDGGINLWYYQKWWNMALTAQKWFSHSVSLWERPQPLIPVPPRAARQVEWKLSYATLLMRAWKKGREKTGRMKGNKEVKKRTLKKNQQKYYIKIR